jgi:hypothetical protein
LKIFADDGAILEFILDPYKHQHRELKEHWADEARALPWQMRSAKSAVAVVSSAELWQRGRLDGVILVSPARIHHAWARDEYPRHCTVPFVAHSWNCMKDQTPAQKESLERLRVGVKRGELGVLCVNKEALLKQRVWKVVRAFAKAYRCMLIVDESHHWGGAGKKGSKRIRALALYCPYRRILSGTMVGNNPGRVYAQYQILKEGGLGYKNAAEFVAAHGTFVFDGRHWVQDKKVWKDLDVLRARMAEWGRPVLRSDCPDLPPVISSRQYHELSTLAREEYEMAMEEAKEYDPPNLNLARKAAMAGKPEVLREILPGLLEGGPVVVWAPFKETVDGVEGILATSGFMAAAHHGDMSTRDRERAIAAVFKYDGVLVSTPDSLQEGSVGLERARSMVWYAPPWDVITFDQARERCTAMGGEATVEVQMCAKDTLEAGVYRCLEKKEDVADWMIGQGMVEYMESKGMW